MMTRHVKLEWDEEKREINLRKHGIDFIESAEIFSGPTATIPDDRYEHDEERLVTFGLLAERVVAVAHTETADTIRVISIRKATKREQETFFKTIQGIRN